MKGVNWIAVIVAFVVLQALGFLWYGPLFGTAWMAELGPAPHASDATRALALGAVNTVIVVLGLAWLVSRLGARSVAASAGAALAAWFFFDFTTMTVDYLYLGHSAKLVGINMGYQLVAYALTGAVLGMLKPKAAVA